MTRGAFLAVAALVGLWIVPQAALAVDFKVVTITIQPTHPIPAGSGTITSTDGAFNCRVVVGNVSGACSHSYLVVTSAIVAFTWDPDPDSCLVGILLVCDTSSYSGTSEFTTNAIINTLGFQATKATVYVARDGTGSGTVTSSPAGISCGSTCAASFALGTNVSLTAVPAPGSTFVGWDNEGPCSLAGSTCTFAVDGVTVRAAFGSATPAPVTPPPPPTTPPATTPPASQPASSPGSTSRPTTPTATPGAFPLRSITPTTDAAASHAVGASAQPSPAGSDGASPSGSEDPAAVPVTTVVPPGAGPSADILVLAIAIIVLGALVASGLAVGLGRRREKPRTFEAADRM